MRPQLTIEGLATFFLCLGCALVEGPVAPFTIGALLMALVYLGGPISRAQYNPAVTLAFCLRRRQAWSAGAAYAGVQLGAALAAAVVAGLLHGHNEESGARVLEALQQPMLDGWVAGTTTEFLGVFLLVFVILLVATSRLTVGNGYYGLAIGATVAGLMGVFAGFDPDFNPAVSLTKALLGPFGALRAEHGLWAALGQQLAYLAHATPRILLGLVGQGLGAGAAVWTFFRVFPEER